MERELVVEGKERENEGPHTHTQQQQLQEQYSSNTNTRHERGDFFGFNILGTSFLFFFFSFFEDGGSEGVD